MENQFVSGSGHDATLHFNNKRYPNFVVISHGQSAKSTEKTIRSYKSVDCHPPLPDNFLAFRRLPRSFAAAFADPAFILTMQSNRDKLKQFLKSFGLFALRCYVDRVKLDFDLDNIFIGDDPYPVIKGVVLENFGALIPEGEVLEKVSKVYFGSLKPSNKFQDWKEKVVKVYNEVLEKMALKGDEELSLFVTQLSSTTNPRGFASVFKTSVFWSTYKRMEVLMQLETMLDEIGLLEFYDHCDFSILRGWRTKMLRDDMIEPLVLSKVAKNIFHGQVADRHEIDSLLKFIRTCVGHFSTATPGNQFTSELSFVKHLDTKFPKIMLAVYEGCIRVDQAGKFSFELNAI